MDNFAIIRSEFIDINYNLVVIQCNNLIFYEVKWKNRIRLDMIHCCWKMYSKELTRTKVFCFDKISIFLFFKVSSLLLLSYFFSNFVRMLAICYKCSTSVLLYFYQIFLVYGMLLTKPCCFFENGFFGVYIWGLKILVIITRLLFCVNEYLLFYSHML